MNIQTHPTPACAAVPRRLSLNHADRIQLGSRLRRLREAEGLSVLEVAENVLGYRGSHAAVSRLERGVAVSVNRSHVATLATFYSTTIEAVLAGSEDTTATAPPVLGGKWGLRDVAPNVHHRLRSLRQAANLTQKEFCTRMRLKGASHYALIEKGLVTPRPDELLRVAMEFNVSGSWLILGRKGTVPKPTQALRVRAMRILKDVSIPALALQAAPEHFREMRTSVACCENRGLVIPFPLLEKLAVAFDVPPEFLDPQQTSVNANLAQLEFADAAQARYAEELALPKVTQKLLDQIRALAANDMLTTADTALLLKQLSMRVWKRTAQAA